MKYYKAVFNITDTGSQSQADSIRIQTAKDVLCAIAAEAGFESFEENEDGVCGYVQQHLYDKDTLMAALEMFPVENVHIDAEVSEAEDKDWNSSWEEQGFEPIVINGKCIIHDTIHPVKNIDENVLDITIDAKQAFGTGTHDTTKMIVTALLDMNLNGMSILDCGCGTGILSIVASLSGADSVTGYDIDEWSVANTRHNCELNNIENVNVIKGDAGIIGSLNKSFNVVLANINRNILLADMPAFRSVMADNTLLILSGFYSDDTPLLVMKAEKLGLQLVKSTQSNDWCMLVFKA